MLPRFSRSKALGKPARFGFFVYVARANALVDQVPLFGLRRAERP